jgi:ABC-type bacteriocin/lantibiotic exporter with double-glycine peptidase domain
MKKTIQHIITIILDKWYALFGILALFVLLSSFELFGLALISTAVGSGYEAESSSGRLNELLEYLSNGLGVSVINLITGFYLFKFIFSIVCVWAINLYTNQLSVELREKLVKLYLFGSFSNSVSTQSESEAVQDILIFTGQVAQKVIKPLFQIITDQIMLILLIGYLYLSNPEQTIIILTIMGSVFILYSLSTGGVLTRSSLRINKSNKKIIEDLKEVFVFAKEIRVYGFGGYYLGQLMADFKAIRNSQTISDVISIAPKYIFEFLIVAIIISLVFIGHDRTTIGATLIIYGVASVRILPMITSITSAVNNIKFGMPAVHRINNLLNMIDGRGGQVQDKNFDNERLLEFESLTGQDISYSVGGRVIFDKLNFNIFAGQFIGVYGKSGKGKSTLLNIILGYVKPNSGKLILNGMTLDGNNAAIFLNKVGYVGQDSIVLKGTIGFNVAFKDSLSYHEKQRVIEIVRLVGLGDLLFNRIQKQYDEELVSSIVEGLSGGQRQRLAIARALYHDRKVLILDESTNALDRNSEKELLSVVKGISPKRTIIMVSHNYELFEDADGIVRL